MYRKLLFIVSLIFVSSNAYANTVSVQPFLSGSDVTIQALETQRQTFQNVINGNIEGGGQNIKAGSITSSDLATSINPVVFLGESFNDWTFSGMLPPTSGTLSTTISAGVSYVSGVRVETAATAHTYTASKDTYTYINAGGFFDYVEVANGAAAPSTPTDDLLLAKVVTSGTAVTSVTDLRTLSIQITANSSNQAQDYRDGALIIIDSTTAVHGEPGQFSIGNTMYTNTADTSSLSTATAGNWIEGTVPSLVNQKFYVYGYNTAGTSWGIKFSSADPVYSDTSSNTGGVLRYYSSGGTDYRSLAWISGDSTGAIISAAFGQVQDVNTQNVVQNSRVDNADFATVVPSDNTLPLPTEGGFIMSTTHRATSTNHKIKITVNVSGGIGSGGNVYIASVYNSASATPIFSFSVHCDSSTRLYSDSYSFTTTPSSINPITYVLRIGAETAAGPFTLNGAASARLLGGASVTSIVVEEIV
jgi:hypothetical protein